MNTIEILLSAKDNATEAIKGIGSEAEGAGSKLGGLGSALGVAAAAAAPLAGAFELKSAVDSVEELGLSVTKLMSVTGESAPDASRLLFAVGEGLRTTGQSADGAQQDIVRFSKNMEAASQSMDAGKPNALAKQMEALGISVNDANGNILPTDQLLQNVADKFKAMPDGAEKTALAIQLFGKSGAAMIPFLDQGAAGIKAMEAESDKLGHTMSGPELEAFQKNQEAGMKFSAAMEGVQLQIGSLLMPIVAAITEKMAAFAEALVGAVMAAESKFGPAISSIVSALSSFMEKLVTAPGVLVALGAAVGVLAAAFGAFKVAEFIQGIIEMGIAFLTTAGELGVLAAATAVAGGPFTLIAIAIAAVVAAVVLLVTHWGDLEQKFPILKTLTEDVKGALVALGEAFTKLWDGYIHPALDAIASGVQAGFDKVKGFFTEHATTIKEILTGAWDILSGVVRAAFDIIIGIVKVGMDLLTGNWKQAWDDLTTALKSAWGDIKSGVQSGMDDLGPLLSSLPGKIKDWLGDLGGLLVQLGKDLIGGLIKGITGTIGDLSSALGSAVHAAVTAGTNAAGAHSPATATIPLGESLVQGVIQGMQNQQSGLGAALLSGLPGAGQSTVPGVAGGAGLGGAAGGTHFHLYIDGTQVAAALGPAQEAMRRARMVGPGSLAR
jgi:phage-related protein